MWLDITQGKLLINMEYLEPRDKEFNKYMHVILLPYAGKVNDTVQIEQLHVPIWVGFFCIRIKHIYRSLDHVTIFYYHQSYNVQDLVYIWL